MYSNQKHIPFQPHDKDTQRLRARIAGPASPAILDAVAAAWDKETETNGKWVFGYYTAERLRLLAQQIQIDAEKAAEDRIRYHRIIADLAEQVQELEAAGKREPITFVFVNREPADLGVDEALDLALEIAGFL